MGIITTKAKYLKAVSVVYALITLVLIVLEYNKNVDLLYWVKPFLIPTLFVIYFLQTIKISWIFVCSLFFIWLTNILFIGAIDSLIIIGVLFSIVSRIMIIVLMYKYKKNVSWQNFIKACFPFLLFFLIIIYLVRDIEKARIYYHILNGLICTILGGIALSSFEVEANRANTYMVICVAIFSITQFLVAIDFYYFTINVFRPIIIALFSVSQYLLCKAIIDYEKNSLTV